ncbi:MAG: glycosyltransferase [bacterium]
MSSNNPLISVIIPTHNRAELIKEAIGSVLGQTYKDFEIIVIDDGSSDDTPQIMKAYSRIKYHYVKGRGVSFARNYGLALAEGELICFLDSDDLWMPEKLERQVRYMKEHPKCSICYTDELWVRDGVKLNQKKYHVKHGGNIFFQSLPLCIVSASSAMFKKEVFEGYRFDEKLPVCEDYDLWLRLSLKYDFDHIPEKLIIKRGGHDDQLSKKYPVMDQYRIYALRKLLKLGLDQDQRNAVVSMIRKKSRIVAQGALTRGNIWRWMRYTLSPPSHFV